MYVDFSATINRCLDIIDAHPEIAGTLTTVLTNLIHDSAQTQQHEQSLFFQYTVMRDFGMFPDNLVHHEPAYSPAYIPE